MDRTKLLGIGFAGAALVAVAGAAFAGLNAPTGKAAAANAPPNIGMVVFGDVPGATPGQAVFATVSVAGVSRTCGQGLVIDSGGPKFVVTVVADDSDNPGCGVAGRTVGFYLGPANPGQGPRFASNTTTWESAKGKQLSLSLGAALVVRARAALAAKGQ